MTKVTIIKTTKCKDVCITFNDKNTMFFMGDCTLELREDSLIIEHSNNICWYRKEIIDRFSYRKEEE